MDEAVCAIRPGTDVGRHARLLARVHDALLAGDRPPADPRRLVARSWLRTRAQGVDPDLGDPAGPVGPGEIEQRRTRSPLVRVLPELRAALTSVAEDARHIMVVTDADGVLLWREGSTAVRRRADALGFTEGATWSEGAVGSNAIGAALAEDAPVQMFAAEHFVRAHHVWTCTACPVHDPRTGELLGVGDVSGPAETIHPTTVATSRPARRTPSSTGRAGGSIRSPRATPNSCSCWPGPEWPGWTRERCRPRCTATVSTSSRSGPS